MKPPVPERKPPEPVGCDSTYAVAGLSECGEREALAAKDARVTLAPNNQ